MTQINFNKGTLTFFIPQGVLDYGDNKFINLIDYSSKEGVFKIIKDKDNGLKVFYRYRGNGYCDLTTNAEKLDDEEEHKIVVTWAMEDRMVKLYIDDEEKASCEINITPITE